MLGIIQYLCCFLRRTRTVLKENWGENLVSRSLRWVKQGLVLMGLPLLAGIALWGSQPTPRLLSRYSTSLQGRDPAQLHNIQKVAAVLDGHFIQPGEVFSFNQVVGPRTRALGFESAPAFMSAAVIDSVGGGICQVSSSLYNTALTAGLEIVERHPHYTTIASVPPGRDATVWYGQADLRLRNSYPWPIQIKATLLDQRLLLSLWGKQAQAPADVHVQTIRLDEQHLLIQVYRNQIRLSEDIYVIDP
jgi:hypothetical protein